MLIDVFNQDEQQRKTMVKNPNLRKNEADWNYYYNQCGQQIGKCYLRYEGYSQSDLR